jgi:hypothetical protein
MFNKIKRAERAKKVTKFFTENKTGIRIRKSIGIVNTFEGAIHLVVALISFYGIHLEGASNWMVFAAPVENLVFGLLSLLTGFILGIDLHHHEH